MRKFLLTAVLLAVASVVGVDAQKRGGGSVTFAISVVDPEGQGIPFVLVTAQGPASRSARTEGGRIAMEGLPAGDYRLRFEREGFVTLERELTARPGKPIDVKVTLTPLPPPPEPPKAPEPPAPPSAGEPAAADVLDVIDREFVGREPARVSQLSCGGAVNSTLVQLNEPLAEHAHDDADEAFYVIAGEGTAQFGGQQQRLKAGIYLFVPRGTPHTVTRSGRNPLIMLSVRTGGACQ